MYNTGRFVVSSQNYEKWNFVMSVCPSVSPSAWNNSAAIGRIFMKFDIWVLFRKSAPKIQAQSKSDKNNGHFTRKPMYIYDSISIQWPLAPKFAGSNPAEAVGFFGRKNPQHAFLRMGSKKNLSHVPALRHVKEPSNLRELRIAS